MAEVRFPTSSDLLALERDLSITFPDSFRSLVQDTEAESRKVIVDSFPQFISAHTAEDVRSLQELTGEDLLPFLVTGSLNDGDIYCFHLTEGRLDPKVSAVSEQSVVATWPSFEIFIQWAAELLEPVPPEDLYFVD